MCVCVCVCICVRVCLIPHSRIACNVLPDDDDDDNDDDVLSSLSSSHESDLVIALEADNTLEIISAEDGQLVNVISPELCRCDV